MSVRRVRTDSSPPELPPPEPPEPEPPEPPEPEPLEPSRLLRRASVSTSPASKVLPRPPLTRRLLSWPRLTYAYTVSGFTPSSSAASLVLNRRSASMGAGS